MCALSQRLSTSMVWYIRFLKSPKLDYRSNVRALITITSDLGDVFYAAEIVLYAAIMSSERRKKSRSAWEAVTWKSGMRALWIDIANVDVDASVDLRLVVNSKQSTEGGSISLENIPEILAVWSDTFDQNKSQAGNIIERRYRTNSKYENVLMEETGESIARHIW